MTRTEFATAKGALFGTDFAGYYDISETEVDRLLERSETVDDFEILWASDDDSWTDAKNEEG